MSASYRSTWQVNSQSRKGTFERQDGGRCHDISITRFADHLEACQWQVPALRMILTIANYWIFGDPLTTFKLLHQIHDRHNLHYVQEEIKFLLYRQYIDLVTAAHRGIAMGIKGKENGVLAANLRATTRLSCKGVGQFNIIGIRWDFQT